MAALIVTMVPKIDWLYPELLSREGLLEILSQRFVRLPDKTENTTKDDLLELYYRYIIPRPQRQYRQNRRGKDMTRKQILHAKKRKITAPNSSEPSIKKAATESTRLLTSFDGIHIGNRLKPPPSVISVEKKVIKLGSLNKISNDSLSAFTSTKQDSTTTTLPTAPKVIKLNQNTSSSSDSKSATSLQKTSLQNKTIKLINSYLSTPGTKGDAKSEVKFEDFKRKEEAMETDSTEPLPVKKVKIKKISWP